MDTKQTMASNSDANGDPIVEEKSSSSSDSDQHRQDTKFTSNRCTDPKRRKINISAKGKAQRQATSGGVRNYVYTGSRREVKKPRNALRKPSNQNNPEDASEVQMNAPGSGTVETGPENSHTGKTYYILLKI